VLKFLCSNVHGILTLLYIYFKVITDTYKNNNGNGEKFVNSIQQSLTAL